MKTKAHQFTPPDSYLDLIRQFPLRPIRNEEEYKAARVLMERLALPDEGSLDRGEQDYLDGLDEFISNYDRRALTDRPRRGTIRQRLRSLLQDSGTTERDLERILSCSRTLVSLVLAGKRELSKENVRTLARHYKLSADYFL